MHWTRTLCWLNLRRGLYPLCCFSSFLRILIIASKTSKLHHLFFAPSIKRSLSGTLSKWIYGHHRKELWTEAHFKKMAHLDVNLRNTCRKFIVKLFDYFRPMKQQNRLVHLKCQTFFENWSWFINNVSIKNNSQETWEFQNLTTATTHFWPQIFGQTMIICNINQPTIDMFRWF